MHYYPFSQYLKEKYKEKVQRVSLDAGFTCPHKDIVSGEGGCIYCNEAGFSDKKGKPLPLREQMRESIKRLKKEKGIKKFIAYFQNATGTNAPVEELKKAYDVIKEFPEVVILSISTRPDCVSEEKLDLIAGYTSNYEVWIEYGVQTAKDRTLKAINRGHTFAETEDAIKRTAGKGIKVGAHVIMGLPGEGDEDMIETASRISRLPVAGVKLHALHVLKSTELEKMYEDGKVDILTAPEYVQAACTFLENVPSYWAVMRLVSDARREVLVFPEWINDKFNIINEIEKEFIRRGSCQGSALGG